MENSVFEVWGSVAAGFLGFWVRMVEVLSFFGETAVLRCRRIRN